MPQKRNRYCEISMKLLPCFFQLNEIQPGNYEDFYLLKDMIFSEHFVKAAHFVKDLSKSQRSSQMPLSLDLWTPRLMLKCLAEQSCWSVLLGAFACRMSCRAPNYVHRAATNIGKPQGAPHSQAQFGDTISCWVALALYRPGFSHR